MNNLSLRVWGLDARKYNLTEYLIGIFVTLIYFIAAFISFAWIDMVRLVDFVHHQSIPTYNPHILLTCFYLIFVLAGLFFASYVRSKKAKGNLYLVTICMSVFMGTLLASLVEIFIQFYFAVIFIKKTGYSFSQYFHGFWHEFWFEYTIILFLLILVTTLRYLMRQYRLSVQRDSKDTSNHLGSARLATEQDLTKFGLRNKKGGLIGKDRIGLLRYPILVDRLILGFRGRGKTSAILLPFILDYFHVNKLITDIKGELCAIIAQKAISLGREVFIIDPFNVLIGLGLNLKTHSINPFAYIQTDNALEKDRYISSLAAAICSNDHVTKTETEAHFKENAQIILEGILDFYTDKFSKQPQIMNLVHLHDWWLEVVNDDKNRILKEMRKASHKARAASAQLLSAGKDEAGSMKTTVYRQLQWLRSENIRNSFIKDEVNIDSFVNGECDIYVVLPEDMIASYSRMVRVVMALIKVKLIQAPVQQLKKDYCFVLDELGQFGYCPDVEIIVNTMRSRGVKVLAAFQTVDQIDVYKDQAVFKGMPIKHFVGSDDLKTLEWIQKLGDKTTVLIENVSRNTNSSVKGGRPTTSETHHVSETQTNLIHFNHVREMHKDEQYVFISGMPIIHCKKAYYYQIPAYKERCDKNPFEERGQMNV